MAKFLVDYDNNELTKRLESIIEVKNVDNFKTHLKQTLLFKDLSLVSGSVDNNSFKLWTNDQLASGATGIFYPIVEGRLKQLIQGIEIELFSKLNPVGRMVFFLIVIGVAYAITTGIIIQEDNDMKFLIRRFLIGTFLFGLFISLPTFIYSRTTRITKQYLIDKLELKIR